MKIKSFFKKTFIYKIFDFFRNIYYNWQDTFVDTYEFRDDLHRYIYYKNGKKRFYYGVNKIDYEKISKTFFLRRFLFIIWSIIALILIRVSLYLPHKISSDYESPIKINDKLNILSQYDEDNLLDIMTKFKKITGVTPVYITTYKGDWFHKYHTLENYLSSEYENYFNDNTGIIIVYSSNNNYIYKDIQFYCYIGEDARRLINDNLKNNFINALLLDSKNEVFFRDSLFDNLKSFQWKIMMPHIKSLFILILTPIFTVIFYLLVYESYYKYKNYDEYKESELCDLKDEDMLTGVCLNCFGEFEFNIHKNCPHCGIKIPSDLEQEENAFHNLV